MKFSPHSSVSQWQPEAFAPFLSFSFFLLLWLFYLWENFHRRVSSQEESMLLFRRRRGKLCMHAESRGERKTCISVTWPSFSSYLPMWKKKRLQSFWRFALVLLPNRVSSLSFFSLSEFMRCNGAASKGKSRAVNICLNCLIWIKVQPYLTWNPAGRPPFQPSVVCEGKKTNKTERIFFL